MPNRVGRDGFVKRGDERSGQLWSTLCIGFQLLFWGSGLVWLRIAGEAGSPLPNNWKVLLFWSQVMEISAVLGLVASVASAVVLWVRESRLSLTGISSLSMLILICYFWWRLW